MKKYQNETDKVVAIARAQAKIAEFLKHEYSYTELMTKTAKAQAQVFNIINLCDVNQREECQVEELAEFCSSHAGNTPLQLEIYDETRQNLITFSASPIQMAQGFYHWLQMQRMDNTLDFTVQL